MIRRRTTSDEKRGRSDRLGIYMGYRDQVKMGIKAVCEVEVVSRDVGCKLLEKAEPRLEL